MRQDLIVIELYNVQNAQIRSRINLMYHPLSRIKLSDSELIIAPSLTNPEKLKLRYIDVIKIYYCFYGRNAWHSTWVQKYYENCMHSSIESAKRFAERNRVQGSVFYIKELPALFIESGEYPIIITQINEDCPLREYSAVALKDSIESGQLKINGFKNNYLSFGSSLQGLILSFKPNSRFWRIPQKIDNSVILLYSEVNTEYQPLNKNKLKSWKSASIGSKECLAWIGIDNNVNQKSILSLYNESGFNGDLNER